jgi:hypothetical protein
MASDASSTEQTEATKAVEKDTRATTREAAATKRSTAAKRGAATRASNRTAAATKRTTTKAKATTKATAAKAQTRAKTTTTRAATRAKTTTQAVEQETETRIDRVGDVAERVALTSVGAALAARDTIVETVNGISRTKAEQELRKARRSLKTDLRRYERRGTSARRSLERDAKKTRTRIESALTGRRDRFAKVVNTAPPAPDAVVRNARAQADLAAARLSNAVETAQLAGATVVAKVTERVASLV